MRQEQAEPAGKLTSDKAHYWSPVKELQPALGNMFFAAEKLLLTNMMESIGNPPLQIVLWNGQEITCQGKLPVARVAIHDHGALLKLVADPELYFGEMYVAQRIDVQGNLMDFLDAAYRAWPRPTPGRAGRRLLAPFYDTRRNTLQGAHRNIHHHYDISNDFYRLWLDK